MPSWFKKVFKGGATETPDAATEAPKPIAEAPSHENPALGQPETASYEEDEKPTIRKVVNAPVIMPEEERSGWSEEIRIKARVESDFTSCVFMVDRPVLEGLSAWFPSGQWAEGVSPLAQRLFALTGVGAVLLHDFTVTVHADESNARPWEELSREVGAVIREHLKSGEDVVTQEFRDALPGEDDIRQRIQSCIDLEINPGIASHSGVITLERVKGNTVFISMGGGCQGCAASTITLRQGIHTTFRRAVPQVGAIYDETDHTAGTNPYFNELPAGMA